MSLSLSLSLSRFAACQLASKGHHQWTISGKSSKKQGAVIELSGASCLLKSWMPGTCCSVSKKCLLQGCCCCEWRECPGAELECEAHDTCIPHLKQAASLPFLCGLCGCRTFNVAADSSIIWLRQTRRFHMCMSALCTWFVTVNATKWITYARPITRSVRKLRKF